jgi:tetratricopeptide (TPR) repeat protein
MRTMNVMILLVVASAAACGPRVRPIQPIMDNGEFVATRSDEAVARARIDGEMERERLEAQRVDAAAAAAATCVGAVCDALARGEVALGMNEVQVLAATRTTHDAWQIRGDGAAAVMTTRAADRGPRDAVGEVVSVSLQNGRVSGYTYREAQGFRTVTTAFDASAAGRAAAQADALLRQGDEYAAAGDLARALDRYDRADIIRPGHADTNLRIATTLDKSLRPIEAALRYRMFIHQMELELIQARGEAAARIAEAITRAQERIVVIERR